MKRNHLCLACSAFWTAHRRSTAAVQHSAWSHLQPIQLTRRLESATQWPGKERVTGLHWAMLGTAPLEVSCQLPSGMGQHRVPAQSPFFPSRHFSHLDGPTHQHNELFCSLSPSHHCKLSLHTSVVLGGFYLLFCVDLYRNLALTLHLLSWHKGVCSSSAFCQRYWLILSLTFRFL